VQAAFGANSGHFDAAIAELTRALAEHARVGEEVGNRVASSSGWRRGRSLMVRTCSMRFCAQSIDPGRSYIGR
jgi:hypothetical protein